MDIMLTLILLILSSTLILISSSNILVKSIIEFSKKTDFPPYIITFLSLSLGSAIPEMANSIVLSVNGLEKVGFYNLINSVILDFTLVAGIVYILSMKKLKIPKEYIISSILVFSLFALFLLDRNISNLEGMGLFSMYVISTMYIVIKNKRSLEKRSMRSMDLKEVLKYLFVIPSSVLIIVVNSTLIYKLVEIFLQFYNLSELFVGFLLGFFSIAPELIITIVSYISTKSMDIPLYNILGAFITDISLGLGIISSISPIENIAAIPIVLGMIFIYMALTYIVFASFFLINNRSNKYIGATLLIGYFIYALFLFYT